MALLIKRCNRALRLAQAGFVVALALLTFALTAPCVYCEDGSAPVTLFGGVSQIQSECEAAGVTLASPTLPAKVEEVRLGSPAYYANLAKNDKVLSADIRDTELDLSIERNGSRFLARIPTHAERAQLDPSVGGAQFSLRIKRNTTQLLSDYDLELILDRSMSMRKPDCPGGLSRWDWCAMQASQVAAALAQYPNAHLTITSFATYYDVYEQSNSQRIIDVLQRTHLEFGTRLAEPLSDRLDAYMHGARRKPLLIAVITDGVPYPPEERQLVKDVLIQATRQMSNPRQVTVVFLQIGDDDRAGKRYLTDLQYNLTSEGARYPIVLNKTFDEVKAEGLGNALASAIKR
ncbi:MAG TPA: hypothetical protein V6D22_16370 [Candidatus Obscuribacterales bacterium]